MRLQGKQTSLFEYSQPAFIICDRLYSFTPITSHLYPPLRNAYLSSGKWKSSIDGINIVWVFFIGFVNSTLDRFISINYYQIIPEKPIKLSETIDAAMSVAGTPLKVSGKSQFSILALTPLKSKRASVNASPVPSAFVRD